MEVQILKNWFEEFKEFSIGLSKRNVSHDLQNFYSLLAGHDRIMNKIDLHERKHATKFNIFYILKYISDKEELLHSPFLAELLNVNGNHHQKDLFYNEFIRQLKLDSSLMKRFEIENGIFFSASTENWIGNGAIDIMLEYNSPNRRFAIAIENKIWAKDQSEQLERYAAYLEKEFHENFLLIYLTPLERMPEMPYSIEEKRFSVLRRKGLIQLMTYQDHITRLLDNTIYKIEAEKVSAVVKQYSQMIKKNFTNG